LVVFLLIYFFDFTAKDNQPKQIPIKIDTKMVADFDKAPPADKIRLNANAILTTMPKKPAYLEIASFVSWGVGKNMSRILSVVRKHNKKSLLTTAALYKQKLAMILPYIQSNHQSIAGFDWGE
jgi:hypothetical protein